MDKIELRAERLKWAGHTLFGANWQNRMARLMGVAQSAISMVVTGARPMTDALQNKFVEAIRRKPILLREDAERLSGIINAIDNETGRKP